jgi:hypothetical protein
MAVGETQDRELPLDALANNSITEHPEQAKEEKRYVVQEITKKRVHKGVTEYLVKWAGFGTFRARLFSSQHLDPLH